MTLARVLRASLLLPLLLAGIEPVLAQSSGAVVAADTESTVLTAEEVLESSERHFPEILQSIAALRGAAGRRMEAEGAFDLVFEADGFSRVDGFYDGSAAGGLARQPLRTMGAEIYGGYDLSDGDFPIYEDQYYTNSGGKLKAGVLFSLLRDRDIDQRRYNEYDARLGAGQARFEVLMTKIGVQQRALRAYWQWVMAGGQLRVYRDLERIAVLRQEGLEQQVRKGARAAIFLVENQQNITRRQSRVARAERKLALAANALSYYYRDDLGKPKLVAPERLPRNMSSDERDALSIPAEVAVSDAVNRRPELAILEAAIERARLKLDLSENELKPRLDLRLEVQDGLGDIAEGGPSRDTTDTIIGFEFKVPLQRRAARGEIVQARSQIDIQRAERQLQEEAIELEVRNILLEFRYAHELLELAETEVQQSETMRRSEVQRFESGASDFFLVNIREDQAADARVKLLEAELQARLARANYDAAVVDLSRLGISKNQGSTLP